MTAVAVGTYTHSVTYLADNILRSFKNIILESGLNPIALAQNWEVLKRGMTIWLQSNDLEGVVLEIYNPKTGELIRRWDIGIVYNWSGDGTFYTDTDQLKYAIQKAGVAPSEAKYDVIVQTKPGAADVLGWGSCSFRSTEGFVRHSLGSTIEHYGLGGSAAYWRKA